jgi:hypothetical protein
MIMVKYVIILFSFLAILKPLSAQKSFEVISKAEQKYEKGLNEKALKLLDKAEGIHDVTCGIGAMTKRSSTNILRAKIYMNQEKYQLARNSLDSIYWGDYDSLRIKTYQMEYGKDSLSNMISFSSDSIEV